MTMLRRVAGWAMFAALCTGIVCTPSSSVDAEQITLRLHTFSAPKAIANRLFIQPWAQTIEEENRASGQDPSVYGHAARRQGRQISMAKRVMGWLILSGPCPATRRGGFR